MYDRPKVAAGELDPTTPPFLDTDPPHWAARGLAYLLILLFLCLAVSAVAVHVPETVTGSFRLVPERGTDPVRALRRGTVASLRVSDGASIARGETLLVIQSEPAGDRSAALKTSYAQRRGAAESAHNAEAEFESQRRAEVEEERTLRDRAASLERTIALKRRQLTLAKELAERFRSGYEQGTLSIAEFSRPQLEADQLGEELESAESERDGVQTALEKLRHESETRRVQHAELMRRLAAEIEEARIRIAALERELAYTSGSDLSVLAPCTGTVLRLRVNRPGAVVQEGEALAEVACSEHRLLGELAVPAAGVALVKPGQWVKLMYDAFPYQRYGVRHGRVRWIAPASVAADDSSAFRALIDLTDDSIRVRGQPRALLAGMGGRADVVVGRRSLISFAFEPIRQLRESAAEGPVR